MLENVSMVLLFHFETYNSADTAVIFNFKALFWFWMDDYYHNANKDHKNVLIYITDHF